MIGAQFFDFGDGSCKHLDAVAAVGLEEFFGLRVFEERDAFEVDGAGHAVEVGLFGYLV